MSLFNLPVTHKTKEVFRHPWEKTIKNVFSNKIKHAHNSINNPHYPRPKEKQSEGLRIQFTVIGNRVTREYLYCVHLVNGLYKYRSRKFEAPVIRGVTSVEWPKVWNDLKIEFGGLAYCLTSQVAVLYNDKFLGGDKELKELIETKYIYHVAIDYHKESIAQFANFIKSSGRPCAYLHISINGQPAGTMIFMLYNDIVPNTCENFLRLCQTKRGGYGGTPVHRIVKDGWIQCGGFGLKSTDLDCENFIVPHDRRGVLCMANNGRHSDCSTQFFVLLQPAPWMAYKYVAFGQLIDGETTLKKIESVPTWYESPMSEIIIHRAGILNLECQDIMISRGANAYIQGHIEDLVTIGELFYQMLLERVFLEIEFRHIALIEQLGEGESDAEVGVKDIRATKRFMRKKEEMESQLQKSQAERLSSAASKTSGDENKDFDVEDYVPEEYTYQQVAEVASPPPKLQKPYYIPLTDVPYPGEVDSTFDLKKFLKGDYCLESDLASNAPKRAPLHVRQEPSFLSDICNFINDDEDEYYIPDELDSDEEQEIKRYLQDNVDRVSFAGEIVKGIAKGAAMVNLFENHRKSELITDEMLRRFRLASVSTARDKSDSNASPEQEDTENKENEDMNRPSKSVVEQEKILKMKRRQTIFTEDLEKIKIFEKGSSEDEDEVDDLKADKKRAITPSAVCINAPTAEDKVSKIKRRQTGFPADLAKIKLFQKDFSDDEDDADVEELKGEKKHTVTPSSGCINAPTVDDKVSKIKRRQTGFPQDLAKIKLFQTDFSDDEDDEDSDENAVKKQSVAPSGGVSINAPAEDKVSKIKRRQTGFPQDLAKIKLFEKDIDEVDGDDMEDIQELQTEKKHAITPSSVLINAPTAEDKVSKIKRRQTGFPQDLAKIKLFQKDFSDDDEDEKDDKDVKKKVITPSSVCINAPTVEDKVSKIKRRQTGFPQDLAKIKLFQTDFDEDDEDNEDDHETKNTADPQVSINAPEKEDKISKIKRRQTGFPQDLENIRVFGGSDEDDDDEDVEVDKTVDLSFSKKGRSVNQSTVSINAPEEGHDLPSKIKRRQTGFPADFEKIKLFSQQCNDDDDDEINDDDYDDVQELTMERKRTINQSTVSISAPDEGHDLPSRIKRRQTGFPSDFEKIKLFSSHYSDEDEEDDEDYEKNVVELSNTQKRTINQSTVSISAPEDSHDLPSRIKRRQTGFPSDFEKLKLFNANYNDEDDDDCGPADLNTGQA